MGVLALLLLSLAAPSGLGAGGGHALSVPPAGPAAVARAVHSAPPAAPTSPGAPGSPDAATVSTPTSPALRLGHFTLPGPHPAAFGSLGVPPGAEALNALLPHPAGAGGNPANGSAPWQNRFCSGLWPYAQNDSASQAYYWDGCYGHDEPGIESYSPLPGSGGNVSWSVTLPINRNATANQSDLYVAIWFGLTLNDPLAWMHQCFLELQFYPDQTFTNGPGLPNPAWTVNGAWIGAAVAWQIEAATGYEDPCFYQPLYNGSATTGPSYFNMSQGDHIVVNFSGWGSDPYGENLSIDDLTTHTISTVNLWDFAGNFPLDPSYPTNTFENGLQWTPGGEYPAVFAFENGHAGNPTFPSSNPYGGCSPGKPPATSQYPSVPCPSYDPGSWANDTLVPWHIGNPTFFNGTQVDRAPTQVAFTQDFGGISAVPEIGGSACAGQVGSAWCSYPWYSYSCGAQAFEFGATDYPGVSADFGQYLEYSQTLEVNGAGYGFYPPTNFSLPTCGAPALNLTVSTSGIPGGVAYFLSQPDLVVTNVTDLLPGNYSISALAPPGAYFQYWSVSGGAHILGGVANPWATLQLRSNGSVTAWFTATPTWTNVSFADVGTPSSGMVIVSPERTFTDGLPLAVVPNGGGLRLAPGVYGIEAMPPGGGANFTDWSWSGSGVSVAPTAFPYAWMDINGAGGNVTVTAHYVASPSLDFAYVDPIGFGSIALNGTTYASGTLVSLPVGGYPLVALPDPGFAFAGWSYGSSAVMSDFNASTWVDLETSASFSPSYLVAYFAPAVTYDVTLNDSPLAGGSISIGDALAPVPSGTTVALVPGYNLLYAIASPGYNFTGWSVSNASAAWVFAPDDSSSTWLLNGTVTVTAEFVRAAVGTIHFSAAPSGAGIVLFNGPAAAASSNSSVANGTYALGAVPTPGYSLAGFAVNGSAFLVTTSAGDFVAFTAWLSATRSGDANVTAIFTSLPPPPPSGNPVTFVATQPAGANASIAGATLVTGETVWLSSGTYDVTLSINGTGLSFDGWTATPGLTLGATTATTTTIAVGPRGGTVTAILAPFGVPAPTIGPNPAEVGVPIHLTDAANASAGLVTAAWVGLPDGCRSSNTTSLTCTPTTAGTYSVQFAFQDAFGRLGLSRGVLLTVVAGLGVGSVTLTPAAVDVGVSTILTTVVVGGVGPFAFDYTSLPAGCSGSTAVLSCTPTSAGVAPVAVTVTDALNASARGASSLTVNPVPSVSGFTVSSSTTDVGVAVDLAPTIQGGTAPFHYLYGSLPAGCASADQATLRCTPSAAGSFSIGVRVTDADDLSAAATVTLTVNPAPTVTNFSADRSPVDVGLAATLTATVTGGTAPFLYSYSGLPSGCVTVSALTLVCTPSATGATTVVLIATDSVRGSATSTMTLTVNARPSIASAAFAPSSVRSGGPTTLTVVAGGGTGALTYTYAGLPSGCSSSNTASLACTPSAAGSFVVEVTATDALGAAANASAPLTVTSAGGGSSLSLSGGVGLGILVAVVVLLGIVGVLLYLRRRGVPSAPTGGPRAPAPVEGAPPAAGSDTTPGK